ncbi:MAG: glycoside hydrolase family 172 protein [Bacteroidota bacterium]
MKKVLHTLLALSFILVGCKEKPEPFNGMGLHLGNLYYLSDARTRSITPENFTGEKGKGGMATLEEGSASYAAAELGQGWKVNPYISVGPGESFTLGEIEGEGVIQHIWLTAYCDYRLTILRFFWDDETEPSVEVPLGDFFAAGWGYGSEPAIQSQAVCVNSKSGFNSYWEMPFRKKCKITIENLNDEPLHRLYYQIDYALTDVPDNVGYFHAQFNRVNPLPYKEDYTIVDHVKGKGQYVGTYLARGTYEKGWWGEGEVKFYMDGDKEFPTLCGTGEEDYFCGSYCYDHYLDEEGVRQYVEFTSPYAGFYYFKDNPEISYETKIGQYRWHIKDPVRFESDLKVTIQSLGWTDEGRYKPLQDDMASVAYWYQQEPHNPFPDLPPKEKLMIRDENPDQVKASE